MYRNTRGRCGQSQPGGVQATSPAGRGVRKAAAVPSRGCWQIASPSRPAQPAVRRRSAPARTLTNATQGDLAARPDRPYPPPRRPQPPGHLRPALPLLFTEEGETRRSSLHRGGISGTAPSSGRHALLKDAKHEETTEREIVT